MVRLFPLVPLPFVLGTMPSRKGGTNTSKKGPRASPSGTEDSNHASTMPSSSEGPEVAGQGKPLGPVGVAAASNISAPAYVTEEAFSSSLVGLEERLAALIAVSTQSGRKCDRSPSPAQDL